MKTLILVLIWFPLHLFGAVGDILSLGVSGSLTNTGSGYALDVEISGMGTNGSFNLGWGGLSPSNYVATSLLYTNNPKVVLTVVSPGFDNTGTSNTVTRTIYATYPLRSQYPSPQFWNITNNGASSTVRLLLSDFIYKSDVVTATLAAGVYTIGTTNSAAVTAMSVNNNSVLPYPFTLGAWSIPGFWVITNNTFTLRAVAWQAYGHDYMPVAKVQFQAYDQHNNTNTVSVTGKPIIDSTLGDYGKVQEYVGTMNASAFTNGDTVTCQMKVFPWVGDTSSVLDSSAPTFTNSICQPLSLVADQQNLYGQSVAFVSGTGSDTTGVATNMANLASASNSPCLSIEKALAAISASNKKNFNRTNFDNSFIYFMSGSNMLGDWSIFNPAHNSDRAWVTVMNAPGNSCVITQLTTFTNRKLAGPYMRFYGLTFTQQLGSFIFSAENVTDHLWVDHCTVNMGPNVASVSYGNYNVTNIYMTDCTVAGNSNVIAGVDAFLQRGNFITGATANGVLVALGNTVHCTNTFSGTLWGDFNKEGQIFAYNQVYNADGVVNLSTYPKRYGVAFIENCFEKVKNSSTIQVGLGSDGELNYTTNALFVNNTIMGNKLNMAYNDSGANTIWHMNWHYYNNLFISHPCKQDTFGSGAFRIGGWPNAMGVGASALMTTLGTWPWEYGGMNGVIVTNYANIDVFHFKNEASQVSESVGTGLGAGDYHVLSTHPTFTWPIVQFLPYDIEGVFRGASDAAGAYASGNVRKGAFF